MNRRIYTYCSVCIGASERSSMHSLCRKARVGALVFLLFFFFACALSFSVSISLLLSLSLFNIHERNHFCAVVYTACICSLFDIDSIQFDSMPFHWSTTHINFRWLCQRAHSTLGPQLVILIFYFSLENKSDERHIYKEEEEEEEKKKLHTRWAIDDEATTHTCIAYITEQQQQQKTCCVHIMMMWCCDYWFGESSRKTIKFH